MRKYNMAVTYPPKVDAVMRGLCTITTREGWHRQVGDEILIHEWEGKPYRSKWGRRIKWEIIALLNIEVFEDKITAYPMSDDNVEVQIIYRWEQLDSLARMEFIEPPTGIEYRNVLSKLNNGLYGQKMQIIQGMVIE